MDRHDTLIGSTSSGYLTRKKNGSVRLVPWGSEHTGMINLKVTQVGIPRAVLTKYEPSYDAGLDLLVGKVFFTCDPGLPVDALDANGKLTRQSPYYGIVIAAVLRWLDQNYENFTDGEGNEFVGVQWEGQDIETVQMVTGDPAVSDDTSKTPMLSDTTGEVLVAKPDAHTHMQSITPDAYNVVEEKKRISQFRKKIRKLKGFKNEASTEQVLSAFFEHELFYPGTARLALHEGILFAGGVALARWKDNLVLVNLASTDRGTRGYQNQVLRYVEDHDIPYYTVDGSSSILQ